MKKVIVFFVFGFLSHIAIAQQTLPADVTSSIQNSIDSGLTPSIVVGIIDKDGHNYFAFGTKTADGQPVDEHTVYEIGSITKTFTSLLLAQMEVEGELRIDDPAQTYLPETVKLPVREKDQITLGHLSDHTSGIPRRPSNYTPKDFANPFADFTKDHLYDFLNNYTLTRDIGSDFEYSNVGAGLLGHILSIKGGTSYENLVIKKIALPLGMKDTKITFDEHMKKNLAPGHNKGVVVPNWDFSILAGAGAIKSSLHDMMRFVSANMGIIKSELETAMINTHQVRHDKTPGGFRNGLGWAIVEGAEGDVIWHNGVTGGYRSFIGFVKETGKGVVVMTNSNLSADDIGMRLLNSKAKLQEIKKPAIAVIKKTLDTEGVDSVRKSYENLQKNKAVYEFNQAAFDLLGQSYLDKDKIAEALAVFEISVKEFPNSFDVYNSYGEALMKDGQKENAINNFKKTLELDPGNERAKEMLSKMGVEESTIEVKVAESILESYVGVYQLAPGMNITITREGKQLLGQAAGPNKFELYAKSNNEFYLKIAPVQITFSEQNGKADSLLFFENGKKKLAQRIE